jgi:hypothetical protein
LAFSRINPGDVTIRHHYTGDPFRLHSFRHKAYWSNGRRRDELEMATFAELVRPGDNVIEVGGHIGYVSLYFAWLVGCHGRVHVFEAGPDNLPYLRGNVAFHKQVTVVERTPDQLVDDHVCETGIRPDFITIGGDGFAWEVLQGAAGTLRALRPALMVEVQRHRTEIGGFLSDLGYRLYTAAGNRISCLPGGVTKVFGVPLGRDLPIRLASREAV